MKPKHGGQEAAGEDPSAELLLLILHVSYVREQCRGWRAGRGQQVSHGPEVLFQGGPFPMASGSADLISALRYNKRVWMTSLLAEYHQGFCEMLLLFHLLVKREHEVYWLFQFFLQKTEQSCVMNIGVGKSFIMLKTSVAFRGPTFAKHLEGKGPQVIHSLVPCFCFFQRVFKSFDNVWRLWEVFLMGKPCRNSQVSVGSRSCRRTGAGTKS
uniref:Rab-GAP TBC domain-containing protein n=1 Tax=Aquila chrysaetos chrysaetos TaxID=223781 RepID=A0A663DWA9_AQUCH